MSKYHVFHPPHTAGFRLAEQCADDWRNGLTFHGVRPESHMAQLIDQLQASASFVALLGALFDDHGEDYTGRLDFEDDFWDGFCTGLEKSLDRLYLLQLSGAEAARSRGHDLDPFCRMSVDPKSMHWNRALALCRRCGRDVEVNARPPANGIDIAGEAVAVDCDVIYIGKVSGEWKIGVPTMDIAVNILAMLKFYDASGVERGDYYIDEPERSYHHDQS